MLEAAKRLKKESVEVADGGCGLERGRGGGGTLKTHTAPIHGATQHKEQMKQWSATIETDYWSSVEWAIDLVFTLVGESLEGIQPPHILGLTSHVGLHIFVFSSFSIITIYFANMWCQDICIVQALKQRTAQIDAVLVRCSTHSQIQLNHKIPDSRTYASCKKSPWPGRFFNI